MLKSLAALPVSQMASRRLENSDSVIYTGLQSTGGPKLHNSTLVGAHFAEKK